MSDFAFARHVADAILTRLIADGGPRWAVLDVTAPAEKSDPSTDGVLHLLVTLGEEPGAAATVAVYFSEAPPREDAVAATANQIQDHAIEATCGAPLPVCPGHAHPLQVRVVDGIAQWVCPQDMSHHSERVLSAGQPEPAL